MITAIAHLSLLVHDYDEALRFYCSKLGFELVEDTLLPSKRWVRIRAAKSLGPDIVLVKASSEQELAIVGKQAGDRVFLFLHTNAIDQFYNNLVEQEVEFLSVPIQKAHGKVAVFKDLYGNRIDLIEPVES